MVTTGESLGEPIDPDAHRATEHADGTDWDRLIATAGLPHGTVTPEQASEAEATARANGLSQAHSLAAQLHLVRIQASAGLLDQAEETAADIAERCTGWSAAVAYHHLLSRAAFDADLGTADRYWRCIVQHARASSRDVAEMAIAWHTAGRSAQDAAAHVASLLSESGSAPVPRPETLGESTDQVWTATFCNLLAGAGLIEEGALPTLRRLIAIGDVAAAAAYAAVADPHDIGIVGFTEVLRSFRYNQRTHDVRLTIERMISSGIQRTPEAWINALDAAMGEGDQPGDRERLLDLLEADGLLHHPAIAPHTLRLAHRAGRTTAASLFGDLTDPANEVPPHLHEAAVSALLASEGVQAAAALVASYSQAGTLGPISGPVWLDLVTGAQSAADFDAALRALTSASDAGQPVTPRIWSAFADQAVVRYVPSSLAIAVEAFRQSMFLSGPWFSRALSMHAQRSGDPVAVLRLAEAFAEWFPDQPVGDKAITDAIADCDASGRSPFTPRVRLWLDQSIPLRACGILIELAEAYDDEDDEHVRKLVRLLRHQRESDRQKRAHIELIALRDGTITVGSGDFDATNHTIESDVVSTRDAEDESDPAGYFRNPRVVDQILYQAGVAGDLSTVRSVLYDVLANDLVQPDQDLFSRAIKAYVLGGGHADGALALVEKASGEGVMLDDQLVHLAITACEPEGLKQADQIRRHAHRNGWADTTDPGLLLKLAGIAANSGEVGRCLRYLSGYQTVVKKSGGRTPSANSYRFRTKNLSGDGYAVLMLAHARAGHDEAFDSLWREYTSLYRTDLERGATPRVCDERHHAAFVVNLAGRGRLEAAEDKLLEKVAGRSPNLAPYAALIRERHGEDAERQYRRVIAGLENQGDLHEQPEALRARLWLSIDADRSADIGDHARVESLLRIAHGAPWADGSDNQLWAAYVRSCTMAGTASALDRLAEMPAEMVRRQVPLTVGLLSRIVHEASSAGASSALLGVLDALFDRDTDGRPPTPDGERLATDDRARILESLIRGFALGGRTDDAALCVDLLRREGRSPSTTARRMYDRAMRQTMHGTGVLDTALPWETMQYLSIVIADLMHELHTPLEIIGRSLHVLPRAIAAGNQEIASKRLAAIDDQYNKINARVAVYKSLMKSLDANVDPAQPIMLGDAIEEAVATGGVKKDTQGVDVVVRRPHPNQQQQILAVPYLVELIVKNLLRNAARALNNYEGRGVGWAPTIEVDVLPDGPDRTFPNGSVAIVVSDNGPGIPNDVMEQLNELGFGAKNELATGSSGGLGLGLALVSTVTNLLGGRFSLKSSRTGTTAAVRLPAPATAAGASSSTSRRLAVLTSGVRVSQSGGGTDTVDDGHLGDGTSIGAKETRDAEAAAPRTRARKSRPRMDSGERPNGSSDSRMLSNKENGVDIS